MTTSATNGAELDGTGRRALRDAIDLARRAPSLHNAQPWSWQLGDGAAELSADRRRGVPVADPTGRELLLGCGAALHHVRVALAAAGWAATVTRLPDPDRPDVLARVELAGRQPAPEAATRLAAAIARRRTDRRPFAPQPLPIEVLDALRHAVEAEGRLLALLTDPDDRLELAVLSSKAQRIQSADPAYAAELATWTAARASQDGVPMGRVPHLTQPRHSDVVLREFESEERTGGAEVPAGVDEQPAWAILYSSGDTREEQLRTGEAMSAVMLTATDLGVAVGVQSQPVEVAVVRAEIDNRVLRHLGRAQLVLRLGRPDPAAPELPAGPRRSLADVLAGDGQP
jgi:Nitroreductase family